MKKIRNNTHYRPHVADPLDPITFVHKINVPVFMACQFEDEQTGGHCPMLVRHMTGTKKKWFTFTNGVHTDSLDPETFNRWYDFMMLYVAKQPPLLNAALIHAASPVLFQAIFGVPQNDFMQLPVDPIQAMPTYSSALSAYEKLPEVRILFDNGAGTSPTGDRTPGDPYPGYEMSFPRWPAPHTVAQRWYLGPDGSLTDAKASRRGVDRFVADANALPAHDYAGGTDSGGLWGNASQWKWAWKHNPSGNALSYVSAPLKKDVTVLGAGAIDVWVKSSTPDVDLVATVSEVRPDGVETFVQNGYLRASVRKLSYDPHNIFRQASTAVEPVPSLLAKDARPMPRDRFVKLTIPLYYEGHGYRAGSRLRITIAAPNGTQPIWSFPYTRPAGRTANVAVTFSPRMPSSLVLPVVRGADVPTSYPPCPSLRNEPCRPYVPLKNPSQSG
jgi:hypothetical protein